MEAIPLPKGHHAPTFRVMASFDRTILNRVTNLCLTLKNVWKGLHTHGHHEA